MENIKKEDVALSKLAKRVNYRIDSLVDEADAYTRKMNEDYEYFFRWESENMYKVQISLKEYRGLKHGGKFNDFGQCEAVLG